MNERLTESIDNYVLGTPLERHQFDDVTQQAVADTAFLHGQNTWAMLGLLRQADEQAMQTQQKVSADYNERTHDMSEEIIELRVRNNQDPLTTLYNTRAWQEMLNNRIEHEPNDVGILFIDLDNFKRVNDEYGHPKGDMILQRIAETLTSHLRRSTQADILALHATPDKKLDYISGRVGGDEFAVMCDLRARTPESAELTPRQRLERICGRISQALENMIDEEFVELRAVNFSITIGAAAWEEGMTAMDLIHAADVEMRSDKATKKLKELSPENLEALRSVRGLLEKAGVRTDFLSEAIDIT